MARLTWTLPALREVRQIEQSISQQSLSGASTMTRRLRADAARLAMFPELGRVVPEWAIPNIRELIVGPYRLIYRYRRQEDRVQIIAVIHGSRRLPPRPPEAYEAGP